MFKCDDLVQDWNVESGLIEMDHNVSRIELEARLSLSSTLAIDATKKRVSVCSQTTGNTKISAEYES